MAQHIGIKIVYKNGNIEELDYNFAKLYNLIDWIKNLSLINKINIYWDTFFSWNDLIKIKKELNILKNIYPDDKIQLFLEKLENWIWIEKIIFIWD